MALTISASILGIPASKTRTVRTQLVLLGLDARVVPSRGSADIERKNVADAGPAANGPLGPANDPEPGPADAGRSIQQGRPIGTPFDLPGGVGSQDARRMTEVRQQTAV
jgi:hypothetical protein